MPKIIRLIQGNNQKYLDILNRFARIRIVELNLISAYQHAVALADYGEILPTSDFLDSIGPDG